MPQPIRGVLPVFQTPYHADEVIDFETLRRQIQWLYDQGSDGIVMAMVSEVLRLDDGERRALAEAACAAGSERGCVVISVGAESSVVAERFARHAQQAGADAVMAIPPVSIGVDEHELRGYYQRILKAVDIPVIVQDASAYVGKPMSIQMQADLFNTYGPRVMFKPEATPIGPRLSALLEATGGRASVFEGSGGIALVDSYRRGIAGTMPGAELIEGIVALWTALEQGNEQRIYELSLPIASLIALQNGLDGFLAVEKYLLHKQGVFNNTLVRGPVGYHLDDITRAEVDRLFAQLQSALKVSR